MNLDLNIKMTTTELNLLLEVLSAEQRHMLICGTANRNILEFLHKHTISRDAEFQLFPISMTQIGALYACMRDDLCITQDKIFWLKSTNQSVNIPQKMQINERDALLEILKSPHPQFC